MGDRAVYRDPGRAGQQSPGGGTAVAAQAQKVAESAEAGSDLYIDWERTNQYVLERGEGECAV